MTIRRGDYIQYIVDYLERNLARNRGYSMEQLKMTLMNQGYSKAAVERASKMVESRMPKAEPPPAPKPAIEVVPQEEPKKKGFFQRFFDFFRS